MELRNRQLLPAFLVAVTLHVAVLMAVFWTPLRSGAIGAGVGGLEIALGAAGGSPGLAAPVAPDVTELETAEVAETVAPAADDATEVEEVTPTETAQEVVDATPPDAVPAEMVQEVAEVRPPSPQEGSAPVERATVQTAEPIAAEEVTEPIATEPVVPTQETTVTEAVEATSVAPEPIEVARVDPATSTATEEIAEPDTFTAPLPRVRPREVPEVRRRVRETPPRPTQPAEQPRETRRTQEQQPAPEPVREAARPAGEAAPETTNTEGQGTAGAAGNAESAGQGQRSTGGGNPGAKQDYLRQIAAILQRNQRYPRRARSRQQEGTGRVFFVIDGNGGISAARLEQSTGHAILDREILAILDRVGQLPPPPSEMGVARLPITVPIGFVLR
ncbi:MAG: TonB family protein [Pseudomonadota bacterium]